MTPVERDQQKRLDQAFGDWVRERLAAQKPDKWTQERLRDELAQRGHEVKREWVNQVINGSHASADLRRAIERLLGEFPEPAYGEPVNADLADAIRQQASAIEALADQVRALIEAQLSPADLAHAMGEAVRLAVREASQAAAGDGVPQRS